MPHGFAFVVGAILGLIALALLFGIFSAFWGGRQKLKAREWVLWSPVVFVAVYLVVMIIRNLISQ